MWTSSLYSRSNFWCKSDDALIDGASIQFEKYNERQAARKGAGENTIPKVLHFIWLGSPLPEKFCRIIESWQFHHPYWEVVLWTDDYLLSNPLQQINATKFKQAPNFGMKSDILRYEILNIRGGVYVDIDYECVGSLEGVVPHCDFFAGFSHTEVLEINNGIIGCVPGHPVMQLLIKDIASQSNVHSVLQNALQNIATFMGGMVPAPQPECDTIAQTGPGLLTRVICEYFKESTESDVVLFPVDVFHCVPNIVSVAIGGDINTHMEDLKSQFSTPDTIAIHWWQRSWQ